MVDNGALGARKTKGLTAILTAKNVTEAGDLSGIPPRTLYRWMGEPDFQQALTRAEGEVLDGAVRRLTALSSKAVQVLADCLEDEVPPYVRLKSAASVLDYVLRLRELRGLENRLQDLEGKINGQPG